MTSVSSCGLTLLKAPQDTFDYVLYLHDRTQTIKIFCHRAVLLAHSIKMKELMTAENYFELTINVLPGYLGAAVELIQYLYLKDPTLITDEDKMLKMCALFGMPLDHYLIRSHQLEKVNEYDNIHIHFHPHPDEESEAKVTLEFLRSLRVLDSQMKQNIIGHQMSRKKEKQLGPVRTTRQNDPRKRLRRRNKPY